MVVKSAKNEIKSGGLRAGLAWMRMPCHLLRWNRLSLLHAGVVIAFLLLAKGSGQSVLEAWLDVAWTCVYRSHIMLSQYIVRVSNPDMGVNLDPTDKVFFFADSGSPGGPN